ncbi:juvenile hormone acid O-methyltransferase-like isoform X1 [Dermacentor albipictus]|uniref:juvenile hormone acid O-methyltransferase-like isoform X1 n=1 Tax=Dermacentor albipictus TaxID=60249 RepID=UPI0031FCD4E6
MWVPRLSKETTKAIARLQHTWHLDTAAYEVLKPWVLGENLRALDMVRFAPPAAMAAGAEPQYLDVGCGPGSFTKETLLPRMRPACRRIVAVDRCYKAIHYAREKFSHQRIVYDILDIESHDATSILERYGAFDRVFSFLTFHYVADIAKAYGNIFKLLKPGGECLVLSIVRADAIDVWNEVCRMEEWKPLMINPTELFPGMVHDSAVMRSTVQLEADTRNSVYAAGLECLAYQRYNSWWMFRHLEDYLDAFMSAFQAYDGVPPERRSTLRDLWIDLLQKRTHSALGKECSVRYTFSIVHARKPYICG